MGSLHRQHSRGAGGLRRLFPFLAPYKWGILGAVLMVIATSVSMTLSPRVEGLITTQLASDAAAMAQGLEGAGVQFASSSGSSLCLPCSILARQPLSLWASSG